MSRQFRLGIFIVLLFLAVWSLYPTIVYHFFTDEKLKELIKEDRSTTWIEESDQYTSEEKEFLIANLPAAKENKKKAIGLGLDIQGGVHVLIETDFDKMAEMTDKSVDEISEAQKIDAVDQLIQKIQIRLNEFQMSETKIRKLGINRIEVELPGERTSKRIVDVMTNVGRLEFRLENEEETKNLKYEFDETEKIKILNPESISDDSQIFIFRQKDIAGVYKDLYPAVLEKNVSLSGERLQNAYSGPDEYGRYAVFFQLDSEGGSIFAKLTSENIKRKLAIVLDGQVISIATIQSTISSEGRISGNFNAVEARDLALILRSGSLPVPIRILSEEVVGPSLGREEMQKSLWALLIGLSLVIIFMIIRYRLAGFIASCALLLNGAGIFALLNPLGYTITIPGIAGLILTMGMAIDANVIIFERIREEFAFEGRDAYEGIPLGYEKAWWSILDANITTLIAATVLASFGSGMIQGFAVVLLFGIITSLFTSLGFTRLVFDYLLHHRIIKHKSALLI